MACRLRRDKGAALLSNDERHVVFNTDRDKFVGMALLFKITIRCGVRLDVSALLADPHRDVGGFEGLADDSGQVVPD
jgi:hypothetical protein